MAAINTERLEVSQAAEKCIQAAHRTALTIGAVVTHPGLAHLPIRPLREYDRELSSQTSSPDKGVTILGHSVNSELLTPMLTLGGQMRRHTPNFEPGDILWVDAPQSEVFQIGIALAEDYFALSGRIVRTIKACQFRIIDGVGGKNPDAVFSVVPSRYFKTQSLSGMIAEQNVGGLWQWTNALSSISNLLDQYILHNMRRGWDALPAANR